MIEPVITNELIKEHGLTDSEYQRIEQILGRKPTFTELGIFSVMWSEHCSYKSSRLHLRNFPTTGERVVQGPGENAGVIDIGQGMVAVFKMESHNHPSYIEPYQGAATGVGGILRDIFTMGARPVASLNSLRFGPLSEPYHKHLFGGVVGGIAGYGNCMGVPTVGGELYCHPCYSGNILVNVFNLGIARKERIFYGKASGIGNIVIYVGAKTGRDGIHGVTMASEEFKDDAQQKKPNVQIGDPFTEKLLLEACLEAMKKGLIVGIQDMGGAGLTSSSSEMAGRAGTGVELELSAVPLRAQDMIPYEIMLSESQERMLLVTEPSKRNEILEIFKKWDLDATVIGTVTGDGYLRIKWHGNTVAEIPAAKISEDAPIYDRPSAPPQGQAELNTLDIKNIPEPTDYNACLLKLLSAPSITSKSLVWQQYDHMVRTDTVVLPGSDAALIRVKETRVNNSNIGLAMSVDCNSRYCYLDPYAGAVHAVCEAARNVACSGATPVALTDCLNFGNPEKPHVMWQFKRAIEGISDACRVLETPVISGNVSFYNETALPGSMGPTAIYPTPIVAMVGVLDEVDRYLTQGFKGVGHAVMVIGQVRRGLGASEYLALCHDIERGLPPEIDIYKERQLCNLLAQLNKTGLLLSAHDCSEGGISVAIAECAIVATVGVDADLSVIMQNATPLRADIQLFGETACCVVVSAYPENVTQIAEHTKDAGLHCALIGRTVADNRMCLRLNDLALVDITLEELTTTYNNALQRELG
ncbi:MAG: phosphoribosylformylglycinamidine synthase subunit PurL [Nitrospirae bacterium]|uniref:phosphoribosylformylglycinamidine synthase subunit PurL n=1 Tax=Candidatus Magnetobacterium casense TaxID=1455061 RepID=UPI00058F1C63|nr:phosphoribosylformylglycinamidine synthase subunit PurL [Candidatus Magnetobacterium casensis]MBF0338605.1 phosphoribosylformylglycinamidine synthase subunit PurL [Nitrospirota bacterium]